jgi:hypothetical protein
MAVAAGNRILAADLAALAALAAAQGVPGAPYSFPTTNLYTNPPAWRTELQRLYNNLMSMTAVKNINPGLASVSGPWPLNNPALNGLSGASWLDFYFADDGVAEQMAASGFIYLQLFADAWSTTHALMTITLGGDQPWLFPGSTNPYANNFTNCNVFGSATSGTTNFPNMQFVNGQFNLSQNTTVNPGTYTFEFFGTGFNLNAANRAGTFFTTTANPPTFVVYNTLVPVPGIHNSKIIRKLTGPKFNNNSNLPLGVYDTSAAALSAVGYRNFSGLGVTTVHSGYFTAMGGPRLDYLSRRGDLMPWNRPILEWLPGVNYLAGQTIIDREGFLWTATMPGVSGTVYPNFSSTIVLNNFTYALLQCNETAGGGTMTWQWAGLTISGWSIGKTFSPNAIVIGANFLQIAWQGGQTGDTPPGWQTTLGQGCTDNQVRWYDQIVQPWTWAPKTAVTPNQVMFDPSGTPYLAQNYGTTGPAAPTLNPTGTTTDGSVIWFSLRAPLSNIIPACPRYPFIRDIDVSLNPDGSANYAKAIPLWVQGFNPVGWWIERVYLNRYLLPADYAHPVASVAVNLGCIRNGQFVSFGTFQTGQNYLLWWPIFTADALVYQANEPIDVQASLVNMENNVSLGQPYSFNIVNFPPRASLVKDLTALLELA